MPKPKKYVPYVERLRADLDAARQAFLGVLDGSAIRNIDMNSPDSPVAVVGFPSYGWAPSTPELVTRRMDVLRLYRTWHERLLLLFPHATPDLQERVAKADKLVQGWLERPGADWSVPASIDAAKTDAQAAFDDLGDVLNLAAAGAGIVRVVPDTNALMNNPDLASHAAAVIDGGNCVIHLLPTVLHEIDKLKDQGRADDARPKAQAVARRLKGLRDKGVLADGVALTKTTTVRTEHREPDPATILGWLSPHVLDDRILAGALALQSEHPGDVVVLVTSDLGLQTKADAARLPYVETPPDPITLRARLTGTVEYRPSKEAPGGRVLVSIVRNVGSVTAKDLSFTVATADHAPFSTTVGPRTAATLAPDESAIIDLIGLLTPTVTITATWTDASGDRSESWTVALPDAYMTDAAHSELVERVRQHAKYLGKDVPESAHGRQPRVVRFYPSGTESYYYDDLPTYKTGLYRRDVNPTRAFVKKAPKPIGEWTEDQLRSWLADNGGLTA